MERSSRSRVVFILLGFFLGHFGVHNFYAGHNNKALIQLLVGLFIVPVVASWTCGLGLAGWWVYLIYDFLTTSTDVDGRPFS
jgi:TM2 domain-containing membrane protein YozV